MDISEVTGCHLLRQIFLERESFLESNSPDTVALCETSLDDLFGSDNVSVMADMHGLAVYVKTMRILIYVFDRICFIQCLTFFFCIDHLFCLYVWFLMVFHIT